MLHIIKEYQIDNYKKNNLKLQHVYNKLLVISLVHKLKNNQINKQYKKLLILYHFKIKLNNLIYFLIY